MNYYEHHIGDYAAATVHLSWDEDMAYTRLLRSYYHHEKGIPHGQEYRLARATTAAQRKAVDSVLREFFSLEGDTFKQKRADEEISRFQDKQLKAKASANARWSQCERNANASNSDLPDKHANALRTQCEGNAPSLQSPVTSHQPRSKASGKTPRPEDVTPGVWDDWVAHRKAKKATVTDTVVSGAREEATKAGMNLEAFLKVWCTRGTQGLQADWLTPAERMNGHQSTEQRDSEARRLLGFGTEIIDA